MLQDLRVNHLQTALLHYDTYSTILIANKQVFYEIIKHIEISCYIV